MSTKISRKQLEKVAQELNDVLGLKPPISISKDDRRLLEGVRRGIRYIDWEADEFSEETSDLINKIIEDWAEEYEKREEEKKKAKEKEPKKKERKSKTGAVTKKSVIVDMISREGGASIEEISREIERLGIDSDHEKNLRVVRLWLRKMGYDVRLKEVGNTDKIRKK